MPLKISLSVQHANDENIIGCKVVEDHMGHVRETIEARREVVSRKADTWKLRKQLKAALKCQQIF
jgi:hypothetical protein